MGVACHSLAQASLVQSQEEETMAYRKVSVWAAATMAIAQLVACAGATAATSDRAVGAGGGDPAFSAFRVVQDPPDSVGNQAAWWVDGTGRVFHWIAGPNTSSPPPDVRPLGQFHSDGSLWDDTNAYRLAFVQADGSVGMGGAPESAREVASCRFSEPCEMSCEENGTTSRFDENGGDRFRVEPALGRMECRRALLLIATVFTEMAVDRHFPDPQSPP